MTSITYKSSICHICVQICLEDFILCHLCNTRLHAKCLKFTKRQLKTLSNSNPFFCFKCTSSLFPFSSVKKNHLDTFNSLLSDNQKSQCHSCCKNINNQKHISCKLGKHKLHLKCTSITDIDQINRSIWSCKQCLSFPFHDINDNQFITEINSTSKNNKHKSKITLNNKLSFLNNNLPKLSIPDPTYSDEDEFSLNCNYYNIKHLFDLHNKQTVNDSLSIFHTNIRSYNKNFDELNALLTMLPFSFDIVGLTETWDSQQKPISPQEMEGYHPIERILGSSQNSGTALYIKESINFKVRKDLSTSKSGKNIEYECLFVEIETARPTIIGVIYRHPNGNVKLFTDEIKPTLSKIVIIKQKNNHYGRF